MSITTVSSIATRKYKNVSQIKAMKLQSYKVKFSEFTSQNNCKDTPRILTKEIQELGPKVNVDICTVIEVEMRRKTLPSIAMCEACHAVWINRALVVLNENGRRSCLNCRCWCISRHSCCCGLLFGWTGEDDDWRDASLLCRKCAKHIWHLSLMFQGRSLVLTLYRLIGLVTGHWPAVPRLAVAVR